MMPLSKTSVLAQRLVAKLREAGVELLNPARYYAIVRTRSGHHQRSAGAWSWWLDTYATPEQGISIGSQYPVKELLKSGFTVTVDTFGNYVLYPKDGVKP